MPQSKSRKSRRQVATRAAYVRTKGAVLEALSKRITQVEEDVSSLKTEMGTFRESLTALRGNLLEIDARTIRGERLMMEIQLEQRHMTKVLDAVATKLGIAPITRATPPV